MTRVARSHWLVSLPIAVVLTASMTFSQSFGPQQEITTDAWSARDVYATDIDGDGDADVLSTYWGHIGSGGNNIGWYENLGGGSFGPEQAVTASGSGEPNSLYSTDLDGDGDADVLSASGYYVSWYENLGGGAFGAQQSIEDPFFGANCVYASDLDGDGDRDVLWASPLDGKVASHENLGGGAFGPENVIATGFLLPASVYATDLDGDGDADVLWVSGDTLAWNENLGGGSFGPTQVISSISGGFFFGSHSVYATDLDGDGDADVVSADYFNDEIAWYENLSEYGGGFGPQQVIAISVVAAFAVYATDLDGDGDADVLSASADDDKIAWYENLGGGSFGPQQVITTDADHARSVYATDLDGDGDADVLSASSGDDKIAWYENLMGPFDCNGNGIPDPDDIANGAPDCDGNGVLDECQIADDPSLDCQPNGTLDSCELDVITDCDGDGVLDECEISDDGSLDLNNNGVLDSCECLSQNYCTALPNSSGLTASISWTGSLFIDDNFFSLTVADAAPQQFGLFFYGSDQQSAPYGDGVVCAAGSLYRLNPPAITDGLGDLDRIIHFPDPPTGWGPGEITPGSTWNFQFWYRDPQGGPAGFNFSDGLEVTFCP
ncbi:MAG: VCBS repeat-containing protein [Planctomycetota bacterium]|nr:VCBS repeat-containing protein [Planctomycetota bacterium]